MLNKYFLNEYMVLINLVPFDKQCSRFNLEDTLLLLFAHFCTVVYIFLAGMWSSLFGGEGSHIGILYSKGA